MKRAIPLARRAWALDRDNPATADTLGWILFKSGGTRRRPRPAAAGRPRRADRCRDPRRLAQLQRTVSSR